MTSMNRLAAAAAAAASAVLLAMAAGHAQTQIKCDPDNGGLKLPAGFCAAVGLQDLQFEPRVIRHTLGCLLARVRGRSPLEYLTDAERRVQERAVLELIGNRPPKVAPLIEAFRGGIAAVAA